MATFEIKMPKLGESITEGTIISWNVKVGDAVDEDDILFEVNTAKVSAEIPSPVAGKVLQILAQEGDTIAVGVVVALIALKGEEGEEATPPAPAETTTEASQEAPEETAAPGKEQKPLSKGDEERWYSPAVLSKAKEAGIEASELEKISGTGYLGRLTRKDLEVYIESKKGIVHTPAPVKPQPAVSSASPAPETTAPAAQSQKEAGAPPLPLYISEEDKVIPMDPIRKIIAERMVASKKISPHVTTVVEADVTKLVLWREKNKEAFKKKEGISLTFLPAIAEATIKALKDFPRLNASVDGYNIIEKKHINLGIAVSLSDGNLIVPVMKDADRLSISGLATSINSLALKARNNKLSTDDIQGGTFTISNFGSFKNLFGTPIINQPEVAILGVGIVEKKPSVIETPEGDVIAIRHKIYLALSYDHRAIDGTLGGQFLRRIADYLEDWKE